MTTLEIPSTMTKMEISTIMTFMEIPGFRMLVQMNGSDKIVESLGIIMIMGTKNSGMAQAISGLKIRKVLNSFIMEREM